MNDRNTLRANIAWLSTCLIVAAGGGLIGDSIEVAWFLQGTFGLITAVGLQVAASRAAA